jgi:HEAT repeat protein
LSGDGADAVRLFATRAYVAVADSPEFALLRDPAASGPPDLRATALTGLGRIRDEKAIPLVEKALNHPSLEVLRGALYAAGSLRAWELVPRILDLLERRDDHPALVPYLLDALGSITSQQFAADAAIWKTWWESHGIRLLDEKGDLARQLRGSQEARIDAIRFVGGNRCLRWMDQVLDALNEGDMAVRCEAARAIGLMRSPRGVQALLDVLSDPKNELHRQAIASPESLLEVSLGPERDPWQTWWASQPEQNGGDVAALNRLADHADARLRVSAVRKLRAIQDPGSVPVLVRTLQDENDTVAAEACLALGKYKLPSTVPPLLDALLHESADVRRNAQNALSNIANRAFSSHEEWTAWWKETPH